VQKRVLKAFAELGATGQTLHTQLLASLCTQHAEASWKYFPVSTAL
jgi:hypothetical protein